MKRVLFITLLLLIFVYTVLGLMSYQQSLPVITSSFSLTNNKFYDYAGITHAHTSLSTGSGNISELASSAAQAGCNFLIITDLNQLEKTEDLEGYQNDILVAFGGKFSFLGGHLLVYNHPSSWPFKGLGQAQVYFNELLQNGTKNNTLLVAAHPFLPRHSWENLSFKGLSGMEILNLDSIWHKALSSHKLNLLWSILVFPFNPDLSFLRLFTDPDQEINTWDEKLKSHQFIGWAGSSAKAKAIPFPDKIFKFPSYKESFKFMKNHVLLKSELTGSFYEDKEKIMTALGRGHFYFSLDLLGDPTGFYFTAKDHQQEYLSGDQIKLRGGAIKVTADLGRRIDIPHEIQLIKDGVVVATSQDQVLHYSTQQKGAYRAVVKLRANLPLPDGPTWFPWIFFK